MYEKKLRELFKQSKKKAEKELDRGNVSSAASYYEQCGDILMEQAKNSQGRDSEKKKELADKYYELRDNLLGESSSLERDVERVEEEREEEEDFSDYVDRFLQDSNVTWEDVAGLEETKKSLKESFALAAIQDKPQAVEQLHTILLYGPPGTGKSLLASAVAGSHDYPFFNVKLSQALSKYYGESGKIISSLFDAAREKQPSILFFDELDSVAFSRGSDMDEASRRVLSTLLTELSGFEKDDDRIMFIGATNAPWDLDPAILSRMERSIYVPLPGEDTCERIIELNTVDEGVEVGADTSEIAERCVEELFSGREVKNLSREAIRRMVEDENPDLHSLSESPLADLEEYELETRPLSEEDFEHGFEKIEPQTSEEMLERYREWSPNT